MTLQSSPSLKPLIAGNWKMNGLKSAHSVLMQIAQGYTPELKAGADLLVCPPATLLSSFATNALGSRVHIGAQDCHAKTAGAHTGDISAAMIADAGATHVILGHSERRQDHKETSADICQKVIAAWKEDLTAIVCVGETQQERQTGKTLSVIKKQLQGSLPDVCRAEKLIIAYEPVWAIGTGLTPTNSDIAEVHAFIRAELKKKVGRHASDIHLLYGGSVKPSNARDLLSIENVNGALVGGASLVASDFLAIANALLA
jgi:triosephosphate isomerase (TIM)